MNVSRTEFFEHAVNCPLCKSLYTMNKQDYLSHLEYCRNRKDKGKLENKLEKHQWIKSQHNKGVYILWHGKDPVLEKNIQMLGKVQTPNYNYTLSPNGKWIRRTIRK